MNGMKRTARGYLCIVLLGVSSWPMPATAQGGANPGPTCDEITSGYICDGKFVPEMVVTAPRIWNSNTLTYIDALQGLATDDLEAFITASVAATLAVRNQYAIDQMNPNASTVASRQSTSKDIVEWRKRAAQVERWYEENAPSCEALANYAVLLGFYVVTGSMLTPPFSFPGIVIGATIATGATYSKHILC